MIHFDVSNYIWIGIIIVDCIENSKNIVFQMLERAQLQLQSICKLLDPNRSLQCVLQGTISRKMSTQSLFHSMNDQTMGLSYGGNGLM